MNVYSKEYGRLGNNMFQRAAGLAYALRYGYTYKPWSSRIYNNDTKSINVWKESGHHYTEIPAMHIQKYPFNTLVLDGYFQSEKYFSDHPDAIKTMFTAPTVNSHWDIGIHVRRGDYLKYPDKHPVLPIDYYLKAISAIVDVKFQNRFPEIAIFSDDADYCKSHLLPAIDTEFRPYRTGIWVMPMNPDPMQDLLQLAKCRHQIISNSTFSWWGAWLNPNPNKIIISPHHEKWFGPGNKHLATFDIIPDSWTQIPF